MATASASIPKDKIQNNYFDQLPVTKKQLTLYAIIVAAYFFEQIDNSILGFVAPSVMKTFQIGMAEFAPVQSVYFIGMMLGGLFGGIISDLIGRRKAFLGSVFVFTFACVLNGFTSNLLIFTLSRAVTGIGIFSMMVVSITYLAEISPAESRGKWQGICAGFGFCAAPLVGIMATKIIPISPEAWRTIFYFGGIGFIIFALGLVFLKESPRWLVQKGRVAEAEQIVYELSGVAVDLSVAAQNCQNQVKINAFEILTGMFKGKYLKRTLICAIVVTCSNIPSFVLGSWNPTLLQMNGLAPTESLLACTIGSLGIPLGVFMSSYFGDKGGRKIPIGAFMLLYAALIVIYVNMSNNVVLLSAILVIISAVGMCGSFMIMPYLAESFPTQMRNTASGALNAFARLGVAASQLLVPLVYSSFAFAGIGAIVAGFAVISGATVLIFGWRTGGQSLEDVC